MEGSRRVEEDIIRLKYKRNSRKEGGRATFTASLYTIENLLMSSAGSEQMRAYISSEVFILEIGSESSDCGAAKDNTNAIEVRTMRVQNEMS